jgi:hypothetical protein
MTRPLHSKRVPTQSPEEEELEGLWVIAMSEDGQMPCVQPQLDANQASEAKDPSAGGIMKSVARTVSSASAGLMSLPQDLLASILKDVASNSNCEESPYSVGQHVEVKIHECFESSLKLKSLVRGWWGATISSVVEAGSGKMYKIKWDKLPAEHADRHDFFHWKRTIPRWQSQWEGPFPEDQIRLHQLITAGGRRKDSTWATQTRANIFTAQNTFPNSRKSSSHVLAAARAFQLSLINAQ